MSEEWSEVLEDSSGEEQKSWKRSDGINSAVVFLLSLS